MVTQAQIVATHRENPIWFAVQIATHLNCSVQQVRVIAGRAGIKLPRKPYEKKRTGTIVQLGRACQQANVTIHDIKQIAAGRLEHV